jgi:Fe-S-cluster containining protein
VAERSPCASCTEGCCREYTVTVTGLDVFRISRGLGLAPEQFAVCVPMDEPAGFRLDDGEQRYRLALDKRRGGELAGWCVFWLPLGSAAGRCGIYSLRPQVCRAYPATLRDGEVVRRDDVLCPAGAWGPGSALAGPAWRERVERQYAELELDAIVNARWNARETLPDPPAEAFMSYLGWLLEVYSRLDAAPDAPLEWAVPHRGVLETLDRVLQAVA